MKYTRLGKSGLKVSRIALGCITYGEPGAGTHLWALGEEKSRPFIKKALDLGINYFDTANVYSLGASEENIGRAIRDFARREEGVIATKVHMKMRDDPNGRGLSRKAIMNEIDASLRRLGMDYVDLYQIHRWDDETPIEETLEALHDVVKAGKARYIGASSMYAWQFCKLLHVADLHGWTRFVSMQDSYNLIEREEEREMHPLCLAEGIGVVPWSPLARGHLCHPVEVKTTRYETDRAGAKLYSDLQSFPWKIDVIKRVGEIAAKHGVAQATIALAWHLSKPAIVAPIVGADEIHQLDDAAAAVELQLAPEEIKYLEEPFSIPPENFR